jgi:DNA-binding NarL/FixJ family response regulator
MVRQIIWFGLVTGLLTLIISVNEYWFLYKMRSFETYGILIAVLFLGVGLWVGKSLFLQKEIQRTVKEKGPPEINDKIQVLLSKRETEVLKLLSEGISNQEIADKLFISENTVKTHTSRLFEKLGVKNRTAAVLKAKEVGFLA